MTEVWNPITKRCVTISGTVAKKLINEIIVGTVEIDAEDLNKLINSPFVDWFIKQQLGKISTTKILIPNQMISTKDIPEDVKNRIHKFVKEWKKKKDNDFIDEHHKQYCQTKKISDLKVPIISWNAN
jgi:hypothetical protein